jgi:quercetin dioxygenase-like cupin family protein
LLGVAFAEPDDAIGRRLQELLHAHQADVFGCVAAQTKEVEGELLVRLFIGEDGKSARVDILKDQTSHPPLGKCIAAAVRSWDLAPLKAEPGDQLVFPLAFRPGAGSAMAIDKIAACVPGEEQAFYVLKAGTFNGKPVREGDVAWAPAGAACRFDKAEVLRFRRQGPAAGGAPAVISAPAALPIAGGKGAVRLFLDGKGAGFAFDILTLDAGAAVPPHKHEGSEEVIYMLSGRTTATVGGSVRKVGPGEILRMRPGEEHAVTVDEKLVAVQIYVPGGPEQRFKGK